jgi:hypothetical protein
MMLGVECWVLGVVLGLEYDVGCWMLGAGCGY